MALQLDLQECPYAWLPDARLEMSFGKVTLLPPLYLLIQLISLQITRLIGNTTELPLLNAAQP